MDASGPATVQELGRVELFATLPHERLEQLASAMTREPVQPGWAVVGERERGTRFYVILEGLFSVADERSGELANLRPGDYFGEVAPALDTVRNASVRALTPGAVASCDREAFHEFVRPLLTEERLRR